MPGLLRVYGIAIPVEDIQRTGIELQWNPVARIAGYIARYANNQCVFPVRVDREME